MLVSRQKEKIFIDESERKMVDQNFKPYEIDIKTFKKMQAKMLEMLLYFRDFCQEHHLMFYLCGGGAIGALREHGFVPWDDDIDCFMPRSDYERFPDLWEKYGDRERFVFCRSNAEVNFHHSCSSLRDPSTTFICSYNQNLDICHGIALEFAPIDGCPDSKWKRYVQLFYAFNYALFNTQRLPNNKGKVFRIVAGLVYKLVPSQNMRYKIWKFAEKEMSKYSWDECKNVTELIGSIKGMLYIHPKEWFLSQKWVVFEGYQVPVMAGYHEYLTRIFGDYMQRPPLEQQKPKHELEYVDMDHPYIVYKGIKYYPENDPRYKRKVK